MTQKKQETKQEVPEQKKIDDSATNSIDDSEMNSLLAQLVDSKFWNAILRYNRSIDASTLNSLASLDPFKEPTLVARSQGLRMGLYHLEQTAFRQYEEKKALENTSEK